MADIERKAIDTACPSPSHCGTNMTANEYLTDVIRKYSLTQTEHETLNGIRRTIERILNNAYGEKIDASLYFGRYHKISADPVKLGMDIVVYFEHDSFDSAKDVNDSLYRLIGCFYESVRKRFSVNIVIDGHTVDLIPIRVIDKTTMDGELFDGYAGTSLRTNIFKQRDHVRLSRYHKALELMRIWKCCNRVRFSAFALELMTITALSGETTEGLDGQMTKVLEFISGGMERSVLIDPGNVDNDIAMTIPGDDRKILVMESKESLNKTCWEDILW